MRRLILLLVTGLIWIWLAWSQLPPAPSHLVTPDQWHQTG